MRYILDEWIALRSWELVPYAYYIKDVRNAKGLKKEEYELLKRCDGIQDVEDSPLLQDLLSRGLCRPVGESDTLSPWQREKVCQNRYFPALNWMITGRCNYNCLHCFNAADNSALQSEFTLEEAKFLIEEAEKCGINAFTLTGGEPMLHPHFMEIVQSIYSHGMYVEELNTNGFFLTQQILDQMRAIGCFPLMKISFDGVGHHDWLRQRKGAEEDALRAIRLCVNNGFPVKVQTNVHRLNLHTMLPTASLMNELGVSEMRIIRTSESPRWTQNAGDACLTLEEYFDEMLKFLKEYTKTDAQMDIDVWQFAHVWPKDKKYQPKAVECGAGQYRDSLPVCRLSRGMVAVGADGTLYPCHQLSGYYEHRGWFLGNVKADGLQPHLNSGTYLQTVCTTVRDLADHNKRCAKCPWFQYCCGGCRAMAAALTGEKLGHDPSRCLFFNDNYLTKLQEAMPDLQNLTPLT